MKEFELEMPRLSSNAHNAMALAEGVTLISNILPAPHRSPAYPNVEMRPCPPMEGWPCDGAVCSIGFCRFAQAPLTCKAEGSDHCDTRGAQQELVALLLISQGIVEPFTG